MQGTRKKTQDKKEGNYDIFIQKFWRKNFRSSLISNPISFSFLVNFEWYKNMWVCQLEIHKPLCTPKAKEQWPEDLTSKSKIDLRGLPKNINPLTQNNSFFDQIECFLWHWKC
jgi:hypothetical protein